MTPMLESKKSLPLLVGLVTWLAALVLVPAPLAARILLLAPLVVVPRLLPRLPRRSWFGRIGRRASFIAALPLVVVFSMTPGPLAAAFALPWLGFALIGTAAAIRHGLVHLPSILLPRRLPDLGIDVALGFWGVGATFAWSKRSTAVKVKRRGRTSPCTPGSCCSTPLASGSVVSGRYDNLRAILLDPRIRYHNEWRRPIEVLIGQTVVDPRQASRVVGLPATFTPLSDRLASDVRPVVADLVPDDAAFDRFFDRFEYLLGLIYFDVTRAEHSAWAPAGRFAASQYGGGIDAVVEAEIKEAEPPGRRSGPVYSRARPTASRSH